MGVLVIMSYLESSGYFKDYKISGRFLNKSFIAIKTERRLRKMLLA